MVGKHNSAWPFKVNPSPDNACRTDELNSASADIENSKDLIDSSKRTIFKVVPVKVWLNDPAKHVCAYAFIDED